MTCNPNWEEIICELLPRKKATDRHDVVARVFNQKVKTFVAVITKGQIFGAVRCWMFTVEWQKRGLSHIHVLLWLFNKIQPQQIDSVIRAEIPHHNIDPNLHDLVVKHVVHGPCRAINPRSPCMKNKKCSKKYSKPLISETQTNDNGYPLYRRRSTVYGGHTAQVNIAAGIRGPINMDNSLIVQYSPDLTKIVNAHISVEYCSLVISIKYVCKYVNKGSDQNVFNLVREAAPEVRRDEVTPECSEMD